MFDTHPSLDARIESLEKMGGFQLSDLIGQQPKLG
jgi:hypothetical protein